MLLSLANGQPGSGSRYQQKEDVVGEGQYANLLIQTKNVSGQASHSLKLEDLVNLRRNSSQVGKTGVYIINYGDKKEYVVMRLEDFNYYFKEPEDDISKEQE